MRKQQMRVQHDIQVRLYRAGFYAEANAIDVAFSQGAVAIAAAFNRGRRLLEGEDKPGISRSAY